MFKGGLQAMWGSSAASVLVIAWPKNLKKLPAGDERR
jgi:hypothetical protein